MSVFSFHITASCHILTITVSTVLVLIYCPLPASPRAALVDIFCYATRYVSHCVCEDVCRISFMVLVLVALLWLSCVALELPLAQVHRCCCYHLLSVRFCRSLFVYAGSCWSCGAACALAVSMASCSLILFSYIFVFRYVVCWRLAFSVNVSFVCSSSRIVFQHTCSDIACVTACRCVVWSFHTVSILLWLFAHNIVAAFPSLYRQRGQSLFGSSDVIVSFITTFARSSKVPIAALHDFLNPSSGWSENFQDLSHTPLQSWKKSCRSFQSSAYLRFAWSSPGCGGLRDDVGGSVFLYLWCCIEFVAW